MAVWRHLARLLWCFLVFPPLGSSSDLYRCPNIHGGIMMTFKGKCYRFVPNDKTWNEAQVDCQRRGGNLVHIKDQATQNFIYNTVIRDLGWKVNGMWIGAHDRTKSNNFEWVNGDRLTQGTPVNWSKWAEKQPSCGFWGCSELCAQMRLDDGGQWHDYRCGPGLSTYHYCCMYDMRPPTTTTTTTTTTTAPSTTTTTSTSTTTAHPINTTHSRTTRVKSTTRARTTWVTRTTTLTENTGNANTPKGFQNGSARTDTTTRKSPETSTNVPHVTGKVGSQTEEDSDIIPVSVPPLIGGLMTGVVVLILLLLLVVLYRRRRGRQEEPTPNVHFSNETHGADGERQPVDRPPYAAHTNQTYGANHASVAVERPPDVTHRKEREQNRLNGACSKDSGEWRDSQSPYDIIPFDEGSEEEKPSAASAEYLHAKALGRVNKVENLDSLERPRSATENPYSNMARFDMGESTWEDPELHQPREGSGKQLDEYLSPSQMTMPVLGASSREDMTDPATPATPEASDDGTLTPPPSSGNDTGTVFGLDTLSANRNNSENLYQSMYETDT